MVAIGAISTMPAPTPLRRDVPLLVWALRVVRRETSTRPDVRPVVPAGLADADTGADPGPPGGDGGVPAGACPAGGAVLPGGDGAPAAGAGAEVGAPALGASPQVSQ
jgi:hypothetical protein